MKLLPSFTGGKARWVRKLEQFRGKPMVEPFAGSAAISFDLASWAHWNDVDPVLVKILQCFPDQIVGDVFSLRDYYECRRLPDWWRYAFCLQRMAFGGLFRHGPNGFNVPPDKRIAGVRLRPDYEAALVRWRELQPIVTCGDWTKIEPFAYVDKVVIIDPPFKNSHTPYNNCRDYRQLWDAVPRIAELAETVIAFEFEDVLERVFPGRELVTRLSRINGKRPARPEAMVVLGQGAEALA